MAQIEFKHAREGIIKDLRKWWFAAIKPELSNYCEQEQLFGSEVYEAFAKARNEIRDSGNCIAVGLDTAAVFHLMRVAEFGLRALAKKLRVQLTHSGRFRWFRNPHRRRVSTTLRHSGLEFSEYLSRSIAVC
jgi:hypothetical protein